MAERFKWTEVSADYVVMELVKIDFVNANNVIDTDDATLKSDVTPEDTAAIQSVKIKTFGAGLEEQLSSSTPSSTSRTNCSDP